MMGTWEPVSAMMQWWIPLMISVPITTWYLIATWKYRKSYPTPLLLFHYPYLIWFGTRGIGAVLIHEHITNADLIIRMALLLVSILVVFSAYQLARSRVEREHDRQQFLAGPGEVLWSPEPIVGYRLTIHSMGNEVYTGERAKCRLGDERYHDPEDVPTWGCRCGYYAMKEPQSVSYGFAVVVLMWGRVIESENGYRSEYMRPIGYWGSQPELDRREVEISSFGSAFTKTLVIASDTYRLEGFYHLPVAYTKEELTALIKKARESFDATAPPPYDRSHNGYRQADTQN